MRKSGDFPLPTEDNLRLPEVIFLKWNALQRFPGMFASEAKGLSLIPGYKERFDIYNLYPLLVHLNLFGAGYKSQVVSIVNRFV